jgi:DNA polymerase-1
MKEETFATYAAQYGIELDVKRAKKVKQVWASTYPEMKRFWSLPNYEAAPITRTGRVRANTRYTNFLNTFFQGLGADGAKIALYELEKQGMRVVGFVHDEVIIEVNDQDLEKGKEILEKTMIESMRKVVPDVKISVESTFSKRYCK